MNLNLRHIQAVQAICQQGSFARAAATLGVVPSALSETIRQLEESLGAALFDRRLRPPQLTDLGRQFLSETAPLLDGIEAAFGRARAYANLDSGALAVGAAPSAIGALVGPALARFRSRHPAVRCHLEDDIAENLSEMVVDGRLDLAVAGTARQTAELRHSLLSRDRFGLALSADHPLARLKSVKLDDVPAAELIALDESTGTRQLLERCAELPQEMRQGQITAHSTIGQLCLIRAGVGIGLLPQNAVALFGDPRIRFVPLADLDLWRSLYLLEPLARAQSHIAAVFVDDLKYMARSHAGLAWEKWRASTEEPGGVLWET